MARIRAHFRSYIDRRAAVPSFRFGTKHTVYEAAFQWYGLSAYTRSIPLTVYFPCRQSGIQTSYHDDCHADTREHDPGLIHHLRTIGNARPLMQARYFRVRVQGRRTDDCLSDEGSDSGARTSLPTHKSLLRVQIRTPAQETTRRRNTQSLKSSYKPTSRVAC
jgi:hypothetical protein